MNCTASTPFIEALRQTDPVERQLSLFRIDQATGLPFALPTSTLPPDPPPSLEAARGTAAHSAAEAVLAGDLSLWNLTDYVCPTTDIPIDEDLADIVRTYIEALRALPGLDYYCEQRVTLHTYCYGTSDFISFDPNAQILYVRDLKAGKGQPVYAAGNSQLYIYAAAAYLNLRTELAGLTSITSVNAGIIQPARDIDDHIELTTEYLLEYSEQVTQTILDTERGENLSFNPDPHNQCRWCPAVSLCPAYSETHVASAVTDLSDEIINSTEQELWPMPSKLTDWGDRRRLVPFLELWIKRVKQHTDHMMLEDTVPAGDSLLHTFTIRDGKPGDRKWKSEEHALAYAQQWDLSETESMTQPTLKSVPQMEKAARTKSGESLKLVRVSDEAVTRSEGRRKIVPISTAAEDSDDA